MATEAPVQPVAAGSKREVHEEAEPPLDEVMLAMDVVDTLRRRERLVERELDIEGREEDLKERLRRIYKAQGIDVPVRILEEGVAALKEDRFVYKPPEAGLVVRLARLYVTRWQWARWVLGGLAVLLAVVAINYFVNVAPNAALPGEIADSHARAVEVAESVDAKAAVDRLFQAARTSLDAGDSSAARTALATLEGLRTTLSQQYTLRIVNQPGELSGVWRVPDVNTQARNYYVIVEALDPTGRVLTVPVKNEETGQTEPVNKWGVRVDAETFEAVARDKQDDGIIQRDRVGTKRRGHLVPDYEMPTAGGAITEW